MIEAIFVANKKREPQLSVSAIQVVAGKGIMGDRYFNHLKKPGQNITFIAAEEVENFNLMTGRSIQACDLRRNIVTRSIQLNELVGKHFQIGEVQFYGIELCEPCKTLGKLLTTPAMQPQEVIKAWTHKAGLRANIVTSGFIRVGMAFRF